MWWIWVLVTTIVVIATGIAIMFAWTAVNQLLGGQGEAVNWLPTIISLVVVFLAGGVFAALSNRLALIAKREDASHQ